MKPASYLSRLSIICFAAIVAAACTPVVRSGGEVIDTRYAVGGGTFVSGPVIYVFARLREHDGMTAVCGAWTQESFSGLSALASHDVLQGVRIRHGGATLISDVSDFPELRFRQNMRGQRAGCFTTTVPWTAAYASEPPDIVATIFQRAFNRNTTTRFEPGPVARIIE